MASPTSPVSNKGGYESLQRLNRNAEALRDGDSRAREAMIENCFSLIAELETPDETFTRLIWPSIITQVATKLASDMQIFETLSIAGKPLHTKDLAASASADPRLAQRVLKILASSHIIKEVNIDTWQSTAFADAMVSDVWKQAFAWYVPYASAILLKTPEFLQTKQYQLSDNALDSAFQYVHGVSGKKHFYEILKEEGRAAEFECLMRVLWDKRVHWSAETSGYYPVRQRLLEGASKESDAVFMVDVGGGHGQDYLRLFNNVPESEIPGRTVLQDLPAVIKSIPQDSLPSRVERMEHDFFQSQPIPGARVYFMHSIIHNYPDEQAKVILQQVARAMKKGYSKLLLWDNVMPDRGAATTTACLDFIMMTFFSASQRTEAEWRNLVEDPELGLKIMDIVRYSLQDQAVIELELA